MQSCLNCYNGRTYPFYRCAICGSTELIRFIDIEDFETEYKYVCEKCLDACKGRLAKLIDKAEHTQTVMEQAQAKHYQACEAIRDYIRTGQEQCKDKEKHQKF